MSKFNIGDKVTVTDGGYRLGETGFVERVVGDIYYLKFEPFGKLSSFDESSLSDSSKSVEIPLTEHYDSKLEDAKKRII